MEAIFTSRIKLDADKIRWALSLGTLCFGVIANAVWAGWLTWKASTGAWAVAELLR